MRSRMRRGVAAAFTVSALCLTAACGGSSDKGADSGKAEDTGKEAPAAAAPLTAAQMKAGLLEVKDLPAGWKTEPAGSSDQVAKTDKPECRPLAVLMTDKIAGATLGGNQEFGDKNSSILAHQVFTFQDSKGAEDFVTGIGTAVAACAKGEMTMEGNKVPITAQKVAAPQVGEGTEALRLTMEMAPGIKIEADILVVRQGAGVARVAYVPSPPSTHKDFDALAKLAGDKFVKGAQS
ncbi:hypothetical protein QWM81_16615 [Streptomyces ficellus]|uniref:Lipoprotein n=1 Tax=Streptomyces ficellus TaxID=1977088 RepID=A0ABT7Z873_9ACTN|nr:hypothetical protein [Streptomyces ficellus]MDN3295645.1 hypothetical protein [Streptomyces ficellus]